MKRPQSDHAVTSSQTGALVEPVPSTASAIVVLNRTARVAPATRAKTWRISQRCSPSQYDHFR